MDWGMAIVFAIALALSCSLFGVSNCTSERYHDEAIRHCLDTQLALVKTSSAPINLHCMRK